MKANLNRIPILLLSAFLLASCASNPEAVFVSSENLEEMIIPQIETEIENTLPEPFSGKLTMYSDSPVFYPGVNDAWDLSITLPGAIKYHNGLYHMFYNGIRFDRGQINGGIGYAISSNGFDWFRLADTPVLNWDDTVGEKLWLRAYSVNVEDDGTWILYLSTSPRNIAEELPRIWRATAPAPNGPWTFDDIPLLEPGGDGEWDTHGVESPTVIKTDDGYLMYYINTRFDAQRGITGIGLATSEDGLSWTKHNDIETDGRFSESDPVFFYDGDDSVFHSIFSYTVWQTTNGYDMFYGFSRRNPREILHTSSQDGITWEEPSSEPVFSTEDFNFLVAYITPKILFIDGIHYVYFFAFTDNSSPTGNIFIASAE